MAIKRKAVATIAKSGLEGALAKRTKNEVEEQHEEEQHEDDEEAEEPEQLSEEELRKKREKEEKEQEKETVAKREKELKAMYVEALKKLAESMSLQTNKRDEMIKAIMKAEAKERAQRREHEAAIRAVVSKKKQELEALSAPELKRFCTEKCIKGNLSKVERVEALLKIWVEDDGINKAQLQQAREEREAKLIEMDKQDLKKICDNVGIEVFLTDVMVDRILKSENDSGKFLKPVSNLEQEVENATPKVASKTDLVDALITKQKADKEKSGKEAEEAAKLAQKIKELHAKSIDELKKLLAKRKLEVAGGKKDEIVKALIDADIAEGATAAIKAKLTSMNLDVLARFVAARGLNASKSKSAMVEALMAHQSSVQNQLKLYEAKVTEVAAKQKEALNCKSNTELKDLCVEKGVAVGGGKEERVNRLVEAAVLNGDFNTVTSRLLRTERKNSLYSLEKTALIKLCEDMEIDCLVKEVMVERILSHEAESGEPAPKTARK